MSKTAENEHRQLQYLWKHRHKGHDDIETRLTRIETHQEETSAGGDTPSTGAFIHLTAASQSVDSGGEAISWAGNGPLGFYGFAEPSYPITEIVIPDDGYYNVAIPELRWDSWTEGGIVKVKRTRNGLTSVVWPAVSDGSWTATNGQEFVDTAHAIWCLAGDTIQVFLDANDSSAQTLAQAAVAVYLVEGVAAVTTACPNLDSAVTVSTVDHDAFPGFVVADDGTHIIAYREGAGHQSTDGNIKVRLSTDGGATWGTSNKIHDHATLDLRDPVLSKLSSGRIVATWLSVVDTVPESTTTDSGFTSYSDDHGVTWSTPATIDDNFTEWSKVNGGVVELENGDWMVPVYGQDTSDANDSVRVVTSDDDGATWSTLAEVADGVTDGVDYTEANIVKIGTRYIIFIRENEASFGSGLYRSESSDEGATWSAVEEITLSGTTFGGAPRLCLRTNGDLIMVMRDVVGASDYANQLYRSTDLGLTFEICEQLGGDRGVYGQPNEDLSGKLGVAYAVEDANDTTSDAEVFFAKET